MKRVFQTLLLASSFIFSSAINPAHAGGSNCPDESGHHAVYSNSAIEQGVKAYENKEWLKAYNYFMPEAEKGDLEAQYYIGRMFVEHYGNWYDSIKKVGKIKNREKKLEYLTTEGRTYLRNAARGGNVEAQLYLGKDLAQRKNRPMEIAEGEKWILMAAEAGDPEAQYEAGRLYYYENGPLNQDMNKSVKWFKEAANVIPNAKFLLYQSYLTLSRESDKKGKKEDEEMYRQAALSWLNESLNDGHLGAMSALAHHYEKGDAGFEQDIDKAIELHKKVGETGNKYSQKKVEELTAIKAEQEMNEEIARLSAADAYKKGDQLYRNQDYKKALRYLNASAEKDYGDAQFRLGYMYANGLGTGVDYSKAMQMYKKAADKGNSSAMNNIGVLYQNGNGVTKNLAEAKKWYQSAANKGSEQAVANLETLETVKSSAPTNNATAKTQQTKRFYSTWSYSPSTGGFWVAGNGFGDYSPNFNISNSQIVVSGNYGYNNSKVYNYKSTNAEGWRIYELIHNIPFLSMKWEIALSPDMESLNLYLYFDNVISTVENYVADPDVRQRVIAANQSKVYTPAYNNNTGGDQLKPDNDYRSGLRYPEYQKYDDERGRFDERKYKQITRQNCNHCHGTGISPIRESYAGSRTAYTNETGNKCPYCGQWDRHFHSRCPSCS